MFLFVFCVQVYWRNKLVHKFQNKRKDSKKRKLKAAATNDAASGDDSDDESREPDPKLIKMGKVRPLSEDPGSIQKNEKVPIKSSFPLVP